MSKIYRLMVFDWEGTLGDTLGQVLHALKLEAERLKIGEIDEQLVRRYAVLGLPKLIIKLFPQVSSMQQSQLLEAVHQTLAARTLEVFLFPGAKELIAQIHEAGISLAIATNKGQVSLQRALQASGLDDFFKVTRSAGQSPAKPCPQMLEEIMDSFGVEQQQTLMIGDSVSDMEMASTLGVDAVGVNFYQQPEQKTELLAAGALKVFDDYEELTDYLQLSTYG